MQIFVRVKWKKLQICKEASPVILDRGYWTQSTAILKCFESGGTKYIHFFRGGGGGELGFMDDVFVVPNKLRHQKTFLREFIPIFSPNNLTTKVFVIASNLLMNYDLRHISVSYYFKYVFSFLIKVYLYATSFVERSKYNIHG